MESLDSIKPILDHKRVNLYFDKYRYKALLKLPFMGYFRDVHTQEKFERRLNDQLAVFDIYRGNNKTVRTIKHMVLAEGDVHLDNLREIIAWRQANPDNIKYVIRYNSLEVYSSDVNILTQLVTTFKELNVKTYLYESGVLDKYERGVVYHREPKHKFRIYLKQKRLSRDSTAQLKNFIEGHGLSISPSLKHYINKTLFGDVHTRPFTARLLLVSSNYIDIDDEQYITVLSLTYPDLVRKVCRIEKR